MKKSADELKTINRSDEDDIYRMLYFHRMNWAGIESDFKRIKNLFVSRIYPTIRNLKIGETTSVNIPFEGDIAVDDESGDSRSKIEKMLYRLSILGIVVDYGLDHHAKMFEVEVANRDDYSLKSVLLEYASRYSFNLSIDTAREEFSKNIERAQGQSILEKCLWTLLEFVYKEIESKRREMIRNMAQVAEQSPDNETFRKKIVNYLETSEFTKKLDKIAKQLVPQEWVDIATNIDDINSAHRLLGGCRRALESYPDHPGLLLLSSYARLLTSDKTALDEFERATKSLANSPLPQSVQDEAMVKMIEQVARAQPNAIPALCYVALQEFPRKRSHALHWPIRKHQAKLGNSH